MGRLELSCAPSRNPPAAGKLDVTLNVTATARDVTVDVDDSGSKFVFTAPRDIEAKDWSDKLEKPFRRTRRSSEGNRGQRTVVSCVSTTRIAASDGENNES